MRWCRFQANGKVSYGIIEGTQVQPVAGSPFSRYRRNGSPLPLRSVKLLVPVVPPTFYAAGVNYRDHVTRMAAITGRPGEIPQQADVGYRANNALIAHEEPIIIPKDANDRTQYEGELVVVIGKQGKHIPEDKVWDYILGYSIGNDFSERVWQAADRTMWRSKNADTFKPMGPWIETDVNLDAMRTLVRVNGKEVENFRTNNMIFGIAHYMSKMSQYLTLYPGDVLWMGTDGVPQNVKHGDVIEIEITGIGVLRNPVKVEGR
ncbi:MAG: fumarylacetoacetate hydrolase family protein [Chloroflexi bacterium]|nr:fumarylacetoacetate hydrolase family protein [Chloroflexota bacterium]